VSPGGVLQPRRRTGPEGGEPTVFVTDERPTDSGLEVDLERWSALATGVLRELGVEGEAELSVIFVDTRHMNWLNIRHMGRDAPTDVLAFPIDATPEVSTSGLSPGRTNDSPDDQPLLLGDVVICPAEAEAQAPIHAGSLDDELALLLVHGILHIFGMDHILPDERAAMQGRERELLERLHGPLARNPWR
jgi:probable rRNA maturation factor